MRIEESSTDNSVQKRADEGRAAELLRDSPRLEKRSTAIRRMYFAFRRISDLESLELTLLGNFASDHELMTSFANERIAHGRYDSVRRLLDQAIPATNNGNVSQPCWARPGRTNCRHSR